MFNRDNETCRICDENGFCFRCWSNYLHFFRKTDRILLKMHQHVLGKPQKNGVVHHRMPHPRFKRKRLQVSSGYQIMPFRVALIVKLNSGLDEENIIVGAHFNIFFYFLLPVPVPVSIMFITYLSYLSHTHTYLLYTMGQQPFLSNQSGTSS